MDSCGYFSSSGKSLVIKISSLIDDINPKRVFPVHTENQTLAARWTYGGRAIAGSYSHRITFFSRRHVL